VNDYHARAEDVRVDRHDLKPVARRYLEPPDDATAFRVAPPTDPCVHECYHDLSDLIESQPGTWEEPTVRDPRADLLGRLDGLRAELGVLLDDATRFVGPDPTFVAARDALDDVADALGDLP
jgi:hypothetical protein